MENLNNQIPSAELKSTLEKFNIELKPLDVKLMPALNMNISKEEYESNLASVLTELKEVVLDSDNHFLGEIDVILNNAKRVYKQVRII